MKKTGLTTLRGLMAAFVLIVAASIGHAQDPQDARIGARALTPQEIHDWSELGLISPDLHPSGGLMTVGVGEPVYLEALVDSGTVVQSVEWSVVPPLAVPASQADIEESPLPDSMPIYSPGDRYVLDLAGRALLVPDVPGFYEVQAIVNTDAGAVVLTGTVAGAHYVGVGVMDGGAAQWPECARCHADQAFGGVNSETGWWDTGHRSFLQNAIDGQIHYGGESCTDCHVLGGHVREADNGGFWDVAAELGWTWPETMEPGNWDAMPAALKNKASIQCEHCHGAGSEHSGNPLGIAVSYNAGDCGQCHDEEPYHNKNKEWLNSTHAQVTSYPTGEGRGSCVRCHSAKGFVQTLDGRDEVSTDYEAISCAACHDPHNVDNHGQLRTVADITLENGDIITAGGAGKFCMNCHMSRRDGDEYVQGNVSSHFGPHYSTQGDMFHGTNAIEYNGKVRGGPSAHAYALENSCLGCHMQALPSGDPALYEAGGHTFKPVWDAGTPDDHSDDVDMVGACVDCHGPIDDFNFETVDYNYDGVVEGVKDEIHHLLEALAMHLPPKGQPVYEYPGSSYEWTLQEKQALYNYLIVEEDGSHGIHNPRYAAGILRASLDDMADPLNSVLGGLNIPAGGTWFYSKWFDFYAPRANAQPGWIYHVDHGDLFVQAGEGDQVLLYDYRGGVWRYTTPEIYPLMYEINTGTWIYYYGKYAEKRWFYRYDGSGWKAAN